MASFLRERGNEPAAAARLLLQARELAFVSPEDEAFDARSTSQLLQLPRLARASALPAPPRGTSRPRRVPARAPALRPVPAPTPPARLQRRRGRASR